MNEPTDIVTGPPDGHSLNQLGRVSLLRILLAWVCFGMGDFLSRIIEPLLGRWFEWPYRFYNKLMVSSFDLQFNDPRGPWDMSDAVAEEYPRG